MPEFLSDEWIAAFDGLIGNPSSRPDPASDDSSDERGVDRPDDELGITHTITGCPGDRTVIYSVVVSRQGGAVRRGPLADPTVTFACDYPTAVAVNRGDEQTQTVFLDGRLRVGGDTARLLAARPMLAELGDFVATLRADTSYLPAPSHA